MAGSSLEGDVNDDGRVNSVDALLLIQYRAGIICSLSPPELNTCPSKSPDYMARADVNDDGVANALDATLILQYHAGLLDQVLP